MNDSIAKSLAPTDVGGRALPDKHLSSGGQASNAPWSGGNPNIKVLRNADPSVLYEEAIRNEKGATMVCANGALCAFSGEKTGRSPSDKRVVEEETTVEDVWWGPVNFKLPREDFLINRERAVDYLRAQDQIYVVDAFAGWDKKHQLKVRVICSRAYHALFMRNMLIKPTEEELADFGEPDFTIYNAGCTPANRHVKGMTSSTSVAIDFGRAEMIILGTQYAGEMKKGILTVMMYLMPKRGMLCLHSSCNEARTKEEGGVSVFFGLSGTGKTTLSADPKRLLIGDDEHVWTNDGIFNVEGGCYAKCIDLSREKEPEIYDAIRFGSVVENVGIDPVKRTIDYADVSITQNTRCSYPLEYIPNAKLPAVAPHPDNVILLTCDAFGVLPPVSRLTSNQVMYQFISGYTAKVAGTEAGVNEPTPTFSACFGGPFLVWHPIVYAKMLKEKLAAHKADAWLINTGWVGGMPGEGNRISLKYTRLMVDAINNGTLKNAEFEPMPGFGFEIPKSIPTTGDLEVPEKVLKPWMGWEDQDKYKATLNKLSGLFRKNWSGYNDYHDAELVAEVEKANPTDI